MGRKVESLDRHVWLSTGYDKADTYPVVNATEYHFGAFIVTLQWRDTTKPYGEQLGRKWEFSGNKAQCEAWLLKQGVKLDARGIVGGN